MDKFEKQPSEVFFIDTDFTPVLGTGESIVGGSSSASAVTRAGVDATATILEVSTFTVVGNKLFIQVKAGVAINSPYKITMKGGSDQTNVWEKDIQMTVKEK